MASNSHSTLEHKGLTLEMQLGTSLVSLVQWWRSAEVTLGSYTAYSLGNYATHKSRLTPQTSLSSIETPFTKKQFHSSDLSPTNSNLL